MTRFPHAETLRNNNINPDNNPDLVKPFARKVMDDCLHALRHFHDLPQKDGEFADPAVEATYNALWDAWHCAWDIQHQPKAKRKAKIDHPTPESVN